MTRPTDAVESMEATAKMLPCPSCGEKDVDATFSLASDGQVSAGCMVCGMTGPTSHTPRDAADRWNALPRFAVSETGRSERDDALDAADRAISELANRYMNTVEDYYCHGLWRAREAIAILKRPTGNEESK